MDYYIGIPTEYATGDTYGTQELFIPGGLYAIFSTPSATQDIFVSQIHNTWDYIKEWLSDSAYARKSSYEFECYCENSRLFSEDIYIPLKRK